jgi:hypothetical protein
MTDQTTSNPRARSRAAATAGRRRRSLYRAVLSLTIAAVIAAWLPFSVMYVTALQKRPATVTAISVPGSTRSTTRLITTASGATRVVPASGVSGPQSVAPIPVVTRDS